MPSDQCNLTMATATGLIFLLFDIASAWEVRLLYHCIYNAFSMDLPVPLFVSHSSLLTAKSVDYVAVPLSCILILVILIVSKKI